MRYIKLSEDEKSTLETLYKTSNNSVVRRRCQSLLFSDEGRSIKEVSSLVRVSRRTTERFFNEWESAEDKFSTLSIAEGRGPKVKLAAVKDILPDLVQKHSRNLNLVLAELANTQQITVSKSTLRNFLKGSRL